MRLENKVALITGGSGGIGRETAILFAKEGAKIVVTDVNDAAGQETVDEIVKNGGEAYFLHSDVSKAADCEAAVAFTEGKFGKLNILFNNAGIMHSDDDNAVTTEEAIWDLTMNINAKGVFLGCKYGIPALKRAGGGSIINTASFVAILGAATPQVAYTASKGAVLALTRELAVIHARENIRVNALCPGPLRTNSTSASTSAATPSKTTQTVPSARFSAHPATPRRSASRRVDSRKKTPCTFPCATTRRRSAMPVR